jgi:hypothetical protein
MGDLSHVGPEDWSNTLRCEGIKIWRDGILDKRFKNTDAEIGIRSIIR